MAQPIGGVGRGRRSGGRMGSFHPALPLAAALALAALPAEALAQQPAGGAAPTAADAVFTVNNLWMMIAAALVFIMHLGFATVETGLTRSKNTVNILFKNTLIPCLGVLTYALIGFNLMYPGDRTADPGAWNGWLTLPGLGIAPPEGGLTADYASGHYTYWTDFLFQAMFAATAATIVSGAVAERVRLGPFLVFSAVFVAIAYPIAGSWAWGTGWLKTMSVPFYDFAGSTLVHSVGGWGALLGAILVGPRLGKYRNGTINAIPGHSMPLATIGVFLLWLGWFGFNGGSVLSADPAAVSLVLVTTTIAGAAGAIGAAAASWIASRRPDLSMVLNGILAGLVGITAGADQMGVLDATLIGLIAGTLVVLAVYAFDRLHVDDPVGALSVHLVCGVWGTLAVGIFGGLAGWRQLVSQVIGIVAIGAFTAAFAAAAWLALRHTVGIRVPDQEQIDGLDLGEHGQESYPDFAPSVSKFQIS